MARRGPLPSGWLSGRNALRVIFGAINLQTGHRVLLCVGSSSGGPLPRAAASCLGASVEPLGACSQPLGASVEPLGACFQELGASVERLEACSEELRASVEPLGACSQLVNAHYRAARSVGRAGGIVLPARETVLPTVGSVDTDRGSSFPARGSSLPARGIALSVRGSSLPARGIALPTVGSVDTDRGSAGKGRGSAGKGRRSAGKGRGSAGKDRGSSCPRIESSLVLVGRLRRGAVQPRRCSPRSSASRRSRAIFHAVSARPILASLTPPARAPPPRSGDAGPQGAGGGFDHFS
jgi:hypothetical protein